MASRDYEAERGSQSPWKKLQPKNILPPPPPPPPLPLPPGTDQASGSEPSRAIKSGKPGFRLNEEELFPARKSSPTKPRVSRFPSQSPSASLSKQQPGLASPDHRAESPTKYDQNQESEAEAAAVAATSMQIDNEPPLHTPLEKVRVKRKARDPSESPPPTQPFATGRLAVSGAVPGHQFSSSSQSPQKRPKLSSEQEGTTNAEDSKTLSQQEVLGTLIAEIDKILGTKSGANEEALVTQNSINDETTRNCQEHDRWIDAQLHRLSDAPYEDIKRLEEEDDEDELALKRLVSFKQKYGSTKQQRLPGHPLMEAMSRHLHNILHRTTVNHEAASNERADQNNTSDLSNLSLAHGAGRQPQNLATGLNPINACQGAAQAAVAAQPPGLTGAALIAGVGAPLAQMSLPPINPATNPQGNVAAAQPVLNAQAFIQAHLPHLGLATQLAQQGPLVGQFIIGQGAAAQPAAANQPHGIPGVRGAGGYSAALCSCFGL